ncbi:MAG: sensor histidine kinase [Synechococcaceae cyanobacterium]
MPLSERFQALLQHQLAQFADCSELRSLIVYVAQRGESGSLDLMPIGHVPLDGRVLPAVDAGSSLRVPAQERRWLPLRDGSVLLGALQVEGTGRTWSKPFQSRLQAASLCLTEALRLDLERQALAERLDRQQERLRVMVHQLRNPLTALRTFAQLLRRRLGDDDSNRQLVEGLLAEERQLNRYIDALDLLGAGEALAAAPTGQPLLLPPLLSGPEGRPLAEPLMPLLQRAAATAQLQHRAWYPPAQLPDWRGDSGSVAEILANLLENAFRYSPAGSPIGMHVASDPARLTLAVWDGGPAITAAERERIFQRGVRGERGAEMPGTGLGLALARDLARQLGGDLSLVVPPRAVCDDLPDQGNAFLLWLPAPRREAGGSDQDHSQTERSSAWSQA